MTMINTEDLLNQLSNKTRPVMAPYSTPQPVVIGQQRQAQGLPSPVNVGAAQPRTDTSGGSPQGSFPNSTAPNGSFKKAEITGNKSPLDVNTLAARYSRLTPEDKGPEPYYRQMSGIQNIGQEAHAAETAKTLYKQLEQQTTERIKLEELEKYSSQQLQQMSLYSPVTFGGTELSSQAQQQANTVGAQAVRIATQAIGKPYIWGGTNLAKGVDCSGLIQSAYKQVGINLPRVSYEQAKSGKVIPLSQAQPGDIVVMDSVRSGGVVRNGHVALYVGNGKLLEAPRRGKDVGYYPIGKRQVKAVVRPY